MQNGKHFCKNCPQKNDIKVGLVNIGTEETKENEFDEKTYSLLKEHRRFLYGNVEARDIPKGVVEMYWYVTDLPEILFEIDRGFGWKQCLR